MCFVFPKKPEKHLINRFTNIQVNIWSQCRTCQPGRTLSFGSVTFYLVADPSGAKDETASESDSFKHQFIYHSLDKFGFGDCFSKSVKILYSSCASSFKLKYGASPCCHSSCGVHQGCPTSPYLFLLAARLLSTFILESNVQGILTAGRKNYHKPGG